MEALVFGTLLSLGGVLYLALAVRPAGSLLALFTLGGYLFLYTPLKRRTPMCTLVGAFRCIVRTARAGYQVLPPGREKARFMVWQSVLPALALVSVTFAPMASRHANPVLVAGTFLLSLGFLYFAARLALTRSSQSARRLLLVSIIYLPLVFVFQALARA
jgi:protoheme IX farnesyltransferase